MTKLNSHEQTNIRCTLQPRAVDLGRSPGGMTEAGEGRGLRREFGKNSGQTDEGRRMALVGPVSQQLQTIVECHHQGVVAVER